MNKPIELFSLRCEIQKGGQQGGQMEAGRVGEIMLYSSIVSWKWDAEDPEMTALDFDKALKDLQDVDRLNIRMNCPGGVVHQAVAMRAMLANHPAKEKHIYIEGLCASAATLIASVPGCVVHIAEGSEYMIHNPRSYAFGDANALESEIQSLRNMEREFYSLYAKKSGQDEGTIKQWMDDTKWFGAKEAVEAGFADELLEASGEMVATAAVAEGDMRLMRTLYNEVPERIAVSKAEIATEGPTPPPDASTAGKAASAAPATENRNPEGEEHKHMDLTNLTQEELQTARPDLLQSVQETAMQAERQRLADIDELTPPGEDYAQMAAEAKANGQRAMDYHKRVLAAQREKGTAFMAARKAETEAAAKVPGGASEDEDGGEEKRMEAEAKEIAAYAAAYRDTGAGTMY